MVKPALELRARGAANGTVPVRRPRRPVPGRELSVRFASSKRKVTEHDSGGEFTRG